VSIFFADAMSRFAALPHDARKTRSVEPRPQNVTHVFAARHRIFVNSALPSRKEDLRCQRPEIGRDGNRQDTVAVLISRIGRNKTISAGLSLGSSGNRASQISPRQGKSSRLAMIHSQALLMSDSTPFAHASSSAQSSADCPS